MTLSKISRIFKHYCDYKCINEISDVKLRNHKKGIQLSDAILYRLLYAKKNSTKDNVAAIINSNNNTSFARQSYDSKESNIPPEHEFRG